MIGVKVFILGPSPGFHFCSHGQRQTLIIAQEPEQAHGISPVLCSNLQTGGMAGIGPCIRVPYKIALVGVCLFIGHGRERDDAAQRNVRIECNHSCQKLIPKRIVIAWLGNIYFVGRIIGEGEAETIGLGPVIPGSIRACRLRINEWKQSTVGISWNHIGINRGFAIAYHSSHPNAVHGFAISGIAFTANLK